MKSSSCNRKKRRRNEGVKRNANCVKHLNSDFIIEFDLYKVNIYFLLGEICLFINSISLHKSHEILFLVVILSLSNKLRFRREIR